MPETDTTIFATLADSARQLGYATPEQVVQRLGRIILSNRSYAQSRKRRGLHTAYDDVVAEDTVVLALAMQMVQCSAQKEMRSEYENRRNGS